MPFPLAGNGVRWSPPKITKAHKKEHLSAHGLEAGLAFERSHTILRLREGVHTPSNGVNTGSVHTENVV
eukprot:6469916-Prymnesium_polylepis.1